MLLASAALSLPVGGSRGVCSHRHGPTVADKLNQLNEATGKECRDKGLPAYACSGFFIHAIEGGLGNSQLGLADKGVTIKEVISPLSSPFDVVKNPLKLRLDCSGYIGAGEDLGCFNHTDRLASETEFTALGGNDNTFQTGWNGVEGRGDAWRCPKELDANFYPAWCQTPKALKVGGTSFTFNRRDLTPTKEEGKTMPFPNCSSATPNAPNDAPDGPYGCANVGGGAFVFPFNANPLPFGGLVLSPGLNKNPKSVEEQLPFFAETIKLLSPQDANTFNRAACAAGPGVGEMLLANATLDAFGGAPGTITVEDIHATDNCNLTMGTNTWLPGDLTAFCPDTTNAENYWEHWESNVMAALESLYRIGEAGGHGLATNAAGQPTRFGDAKEQAVSLFCDLFGTVSLPPDLVPECFQNKCVRSEQVLLDRAAWTGIPSDMQPAAGSVFRANGASTTNFDSLALCMLRPTQFSIFEKVTNFNEISKLWKSIPKQGLNNEVIMNWAGREFTDLAPHTAIWAPAAINYINAGKTPAQAAIMFDDGVRGAYQVAESYRNATGISLPVVVVNQEGQLRDSKTPMFSCAEDYFQPEGFEVGTPFDTSIGAPPLK
jgi:hypothetical protein